MEAEVEHSTTVPSPTHVCSDSESLEKPTGGTVHRVMTPHTHTHKGYESICFLTFVFSSPERNLAFQIHS